MAETLSAHELEMSPKAAAIRSGDLKELDRRQIRAQAYKWLIQPLAISPAYGTGT